MHAVLKQTSHTGARLRAQLRRRPRRVQDSAEFPAIHCVLRNGDAAQKPKVVTSPWKNEEADRAQMSAIPTAVLPGQECARGRHTRAPSGSHPLVRTAAEKDASPPCQTSSSSSTAGCPDRGTAASSNHRGRQVIKLTTDSGSVWMQASLRAAKTRPVHCFGYHLIRDGTLP
jgi:hypothetical protein